MLGKPSSYSFRVLEELVGAVLNTGGLDRGTTWEQVETGRWRRRG
jgi:hypothetical protein